MATLLPLIDADPAVQVHVGAALAAVAFGPLAVFRSRRDRWHKIVGYAWVTAMAAAAVSSFWIHGFGIVGPFGPIHLLSIWTLIALGLGVRHAVKRRFVQHRRTMKSLYFWALGVAGLFTLLPGRRMHRVLFGEDNLLGFALIIMIAVMAWLLSARGVRLRMAQGLKL